jgi:acyl carrier protein
MSAPRDIEGKVLRFFLSKGDISKLTQEELFEYRYLDNGFIDSLAIVEMITIFEEEFNIHFNPKIMQSNEFRTIGGLISLIERLMK